MVGCGVGVKGVGWAWGEIGAPCDGANYGGEMVEMVKAASAPTR